MKYFTPELLKRSASSDEATAEAEWDRACERYKKHLKAITRKLPKSALEFGRKYNMHDARLMAFGVQHNPKTHAPQKLSLLFQLDGTEEALWLHYWLLLDKCRFTLPGEQGPLEVEWLYDELDVLDKGVFQHSILMTGGMELDLAFTKLELAPVKTQLKTKPANIQQALYRELILA